MNAAQHETLPLGALRDLATRAVAACGGSPAMARSLVGATLSAHYAGREEMGFPHFLDYCQSLRAGRIDGRAEPACASPFPAVIRCDAGGGIAQLGFDTALPDLVQRASTFGLSILTLHSSYTAGEIGYYVRRLAAAGLIGLAAANSHAMMASAPGAAPAFGTNPLAFAAPRPAPHPPLLFDQATSATAFVNLARAAARGDPIPAGWALDAAGAPTTDPVQALLGALLPAGGPKGANLALLVEVLAAGLSGGAWSLDAGHFLSGDRSPGTGLAVIALVPLPDRSTFTARLEVQLQRLAECGVHVPGASARPVPESDREPIALAADCLAQIRRLAG